MKETAFFDKMMRRDGKTLADLLNEKRLLSIRDRKTSKRCYTVMFSSILETYHPYETLLESIVAPNQIDDFVTNTATREPPGITPAIVS